MLFSKTLECPGDSKSVTEMLKSTGYYRSRWKDLDPRASVDVNVSGKQIRVTSSLDIPEATVSAISNMLNSGIQVRVVDIWDLDESGNATKGSISAALTGVPAKASATLKATPGQGEPPTTVFRLHGDVTCTVPLIGTGLERAVVKRLDQALAHETTVIKEFLTS